MDLDDDVVNRTKDTCEDQMEVEENVDSMSRAEKIIEMSKIKSTVFVAAVDKNHKDRAQFQRVWTAVCADVFASVVQIETGNIPNWWDWFRGADDEDKTKFINVCVSVFIS